MGDKVMNIFCMRFSYLYAFPLGDLYVSKKCEAPVDLLIVVFTQIIFFFGLIMGAKKIYYFEYT
jgi:hypothetical protein